MRKKTKKDIKSIIQTMHDAHRYVMDLIRSSRFPEVNDVLSQCQECALKIGEKIEESEGQDTQAVACLEFYCEQLYRLSMGADRTKLKKLRRELDESLYCVEKELDGSIPTDRLKIVFMPYKVSMWDCMESVWEAAMEDEECDVYVVPIPYYERNQKGGLEKLCYEGALFPQYVQITSYNDFILEVEKPDIIYIHNPYDGANYVSSVHPDYFSSRLRNYTDTLVYIPYYLLGRGPMPESHLTLSAYIYSDKIILQDEEKLMSLSKHIPAEKLVAIGSPKVDRILKLDREQIIENVIPKEWREKIAGRKVIFFNVSISGILQNSESALNKIRYVLSCFKTRKDVVLLWRPHPLLEATLSSMRPELYNEYMEIKNVFLHKKEWILDETGDAGIAAVIADAYLGEASSSIVHYFGVLGKPVLYIDWNIVIKNRDKGILFFGNYFRDEKFLYFIPRNSNAKIAGNLYRFNMETGKTEEFMTLRGVSGDIDIRFTTVKRIKDKWVLVPYNAKDIYIYDDEGKGSKLVLPEASEGGGLFIGLVEYCGKVFLIPDRYPAIVQINMDNKQVYEYKECIEPFRSKNRAGRVFVYAYLKKGEYLYLASARESKMVIFNMKNGAYEIKEIGNYPYGYDHMIYDGIFFWLVASNENSRIVRWDENSEDTEEYTYPAMEKERLRGEMWNWHQLIDRGNQLLVFDYFQKDVIVFDKKTGECGREARIGDRLTKEKSELTEKKLGFSSVSVLEKSTVLYIDEIKGNIYIWNMETNQWRSFPCRVSEEKLVELDRQQVNLKAVPFYWSEQDMSISRYVDYIVRGDIGVFKTTYKCYKNKNIKGTIGAEIHEYMKK